MSGYELHHGDCLDELKGYADSAFDLVIADPPYYKVKNEPWDRQWETPAAFLAWLDSVVEELARVMKPNASLYLFASPKMAARVEVMISERLNVLNAITWVKEAGWHNKADKEALRAYLAPWERIIFAEHYGADNIAKGEAGYAAKCDELRGFLFEPLRAYLVSERDRAGLTTGDVDRAWQAARGSKGCMAGHWFGVSQWELPTEANYQWLRALFSRLNHGGDYLRREYDYLRREYEDLRREYEDLRREYEELRREYEELRRPFNVTPAVPYTDVWDFPTVQAYPDKHECEKPQPLLRHMIEASSRPGALILDPFAGGGSTGEAAIATGRDVVLIEKAAHNARKARRRLSRAAATLRGEFRPRVDEGAALDDLPLFMEANP